MKTTLSLLTVLLFSNLVIAQTTSIPDSNFEQKLISLGLDTGAINGVVPTAYIDTVLILDVFNSSINDMTGIEDFTALTKLYCLFNQLTSLNLTQNTALFYIDCSNNQLTSLDVTQNTALVQFWCYNNSLTSLNVTQNIVLGNLNCASNQLTCLNVKNGNNTNIGAFAASNNPGLSCIEVDNVSWSTINWTQIDAGASFSTNCPNSCTVGINESEKFSKLNLYPNPTSIQLTIDTELEISETTIIDITGKNIRSIKQNTNTINVADLSKGIYFIKLVTDEGTITKKFVKQ